MGEGARTLSSPSSHLEACLSPSPSRPLRCSALRCIAPGCWCPPVRQLVALIPSLGVICCWSYPPCWDGGRMGPLRAFRRLHFALALSAPVSCPAPISNFFSFVSSGRRAHGTRTQATKKRVPVRVAPSSTGESLFSSFISSHASHLFTDSTLHQQINSVSIRRRLRRPSVSTDPARNCRRPPAENSTNPQSRIPPARCPPPAARCPLPARRGP